ncbi:Min6p TDEL_0C03410 [Torulaspora delbrueckii]|uniref:Uncharacterized protein n=1 Tax=Torulaspora delbrueckii TaxID=4950 RepID=G8ZRT8_TORDE|nr:hypothetical protein TDEL_0C03410 [Torulaspora delbrueckii]CCE91230.1 hypothetical protein TDEL_0C03410 [Torulaspora delbrueckii]
MAFFYDNPVIEFFHKVVRKPSTILMWLFTSVIVGSTAYLIVFLPGPSSTDHDTDKDPDEPR